MKNAGDVAQWCFEKRAPYSTIVIGLNGPQGSGKSTLAARLVGLLEDRGLRAVAISVDDFYLTNQEQCALAEKHPGDRTLEHRGYPGTHDVALGVATLDSLIAGLPTDLPRYDKSAFSGRGDRASQGVRVDGPVDFVIFEGWMLGFESVPEVPPELAIPNDLLRAYTAWTSRLNSMIAMRAASLDDIVRWRIDAENSRRTRGEPALSEADARDYITRFLPAYRTWKTNADVWIDLAADRSFAKITPS